MTSKIRHDVNKYVITSKWHDDVKAKVCQKYVMTSKISSWRQKVRHDVKNTYWRQSYIIMSQIRYDIKKFVITSKRKSGHKIRHLVKVILWHQRYVKNMSWHQKFVMTSKVCCDVKKDIKVTPWRQYYAMMSKSTSLRHKLRHDVTKFVMT